MIVRREITALQDESGRWIARAHVWTDKGYSTKTFATAMEAKAWTPKGAKT
jgi:hypothetical protein